VSVALHDELADLRAQVGPQIFDDPVAFRAAFDDFVSEGAASTGEVSLLVGAISTGAVQRLKDQLALGADPATSIAAQGDLLARDRGTSESDGARWALSVLAHAAGFVPVDLVLTRPSVPDSLSAPDRPTVPGAAVDPGPTQRPTVDRAAPPPTAIGDATRVVSEEPPPARTRPTAAAPEPGRPGGRRTNPVLVGAVAVLAVVAVVAVVLLFLREGDSPDDTASDDPTSTGPTEPTEVVLDEIEMSEAGKTVRVQLVHDGPEASVVLLAEVDGDYTEVDRFAVTCAYHDSSYDAALQDQGDRQLFVTWSDSKTAGHGEYAEVQIDEDMLIQYGIGDAPCPTEP